MRIFAGVIVAAATALSLGAAAWAGPHQIKPASPQPDAAALKPGLMVHYSYPADVKSLHQAQSWVDRKVEAGPPLVGFDYMDTEKGEKTLTSNRAEEVIAVIDGYIHFDKPGVWRLEIQNNDGLKVDIGGTEVYRYDGRHTCGTGGWVEVNAPEAGWYPLKALFFQRLNTSCLLMEWTPPGGAKDWTPNEAFAYMPQ